MCPAVTNGAPRVMPSIFLATAKQKRWNTNPFPVQKPVASKRAGRRSLGKAPRQGLGACLHRGRRKISEWRIVLLRRLKTRIPSAFYTRKVRV